MFVCIYVLSTDTGISCVLCLVYGNMEPNSRIKTLIVKIGKVRMMLFRIVEMCIRDRYTHTHTSFFLLSYHKKDFVDFQCTILEGLR